MSTPPTQLPYVTQGDIAAAGGADYGVYGGGTFGVPAGPGWVPQPTGEDVAALIGMPTAPPPGFVGPTEPAPAVSPNDTSSWYGALGGNMFFRSVRRVRATRLTRMLEAEVRVGLRAVASAWRTGQIAIPGSADTVSTGRYLGSYILPKIARTGLAAVAGWALFPEAAGENQQFPLALAPAAQGFSYTPFRSSRGMASPNVGGTLADPVLSRQVKQMVADQKAAALADEMRFAAARSDLATMQREAAKRTSIPGLLKAEMSDYLFGTNLAPFYFSTYAGGRTGLGPLLGIRPAAPGPLGFHPLITRELVPAPSASSSEGPPVPATPAVSTPVAATNARLPHPSARIGKLALGLGSIFAVNLLASRRSGGSSSSLPAVLNAPGATNAPVPATQIQPLQAILAGGATGGSGAYCTPQPRGPRRKCLERAPVNWRSGRNKGKAAGTKCVRYAQRAS